MAIGRRELGAILLGAAAIVFYLMLLSTTPSDAQTGGGTTTAQGNEGCESPELVDTFSGSNSQITPTFDITGNTFQLTLEAEPNQQEEFASIIIDTVDQEDGLVVPFGDITLIPLEGPITETANVLEGPGSFNLEIEANNAQYDITVEDCVGENQNGTTQNQFTPQNQLPTGPLRRERRPQKERSVINVPNRPLPPSGGMPVYGVVAGCALAGTGLLALGLGIRHGPQR